MTDFTGTAGNDTLAGTSADDLIQGLGGNDNLTGGIGNDRLEGGAGEDWMDGGEGNDLLIGGDDRDTLRDYSGGNDELVGGAGMDDIRIQRLEGAAATVNRMDGGADNDFFGVYDESWASTFNISAGDGRDYFWIRGAAVVAIDAGEGDDLIELEGLKATVSVALGSGGADRIRVNGQSLNLFGGSIAATGFDTGDQGDSLDIVEFLNVHLRNWDYRSNPFATGHFRLVQSGADALFQIDWNGGGDGYVTFVTFIATDATSLTGYNLGGWPSDGSIPAGLDLVGGDLTDDRLSGGAGDDHIRGLGGTDDIEGGAGDDHLEGGNGQDYIDGGLGDDLIEGGEGNDSLNGDMRGADVLRGGEGDDGLRIFRLEAEAGWMELDGGSGDDLLSVTGHQIDYFSPPETMRFRMIGGDGADRFSIYRASEVVVEAGSGNDIVDLDTFTNALITLGAGSDVLELDALRGYVFSGRTIVVTDFEAGPAGDRIEWSEYLADALPGWDGSNPFAPSPYGVRARLVQSGPDTLIQLSPSGSTDGFATLIILQNVQASALDQANMGGYPPDGSAPVGVVLYGTEGSDQLVGTGAGDTIYGLGGWNDVLNGKAGDDFLYGGEGRDELIGELGNDLLDGGEGMDFLEDRSGGNDSLYGGDGIDSLYVQRNEPGPHSILHLDGGADDDRLTYLGSTYWFIDTTLTMLGGSGNDNILVNGRMITATIDAGTGSDLVRLYTDPGDYLVSLGAGSDTLELQSDRLLMGTIVVTDFEAGEAGDRLDLDGWFSSALTNWDGVQSPFATGHARYVESGGATVLQVDRDGGGDGYSTLLTLSGASLFALTVANLGGFDLVTKGTTGSDVMTGSAAADFLHGGPGNDVLHLWEGGGDDHALGGAGDDNIFFIGSLTAADIVTGGAGTDTLVLQGPYGSLALSPSVTEIEGIAILGGGNTTFGEPGTNRHDYVLTTHDSNFAAGVEARINAGNLLAEEDFTFNGSAETDARFVVYGGLGKDTITGGLNNDTFLFGHDRFATGDTVNGGPGYDGMFLRGNYTIDFNAAGYTGLFTSIENLTFTSASDERYARGGGTEFDYNITLSDALVAAGVTLTVNGGLLMANETMILDGSLESDGLLRLFGGKANDTLKGGGQNDLIHGHLGADQLTGNGGADTFRFDSTADSIQSSMDHILDFTAGTDKVALTRIDANALIDGDQAFSWIGSDTFSGSAGELRAYLDGASWFVTADTDGDSVADLVLQVTLQGQTLLGAGDFLL